MSLMKNCTAADCARRDFGSKSGKGHKVLQEGKRNGGGHCAVSGDVEQRI